MLPVQNTIGEGGGKGGIYDAIIFTSTFKPLGRVARYRL